MTLSTEPSSSSGDEVPGHRWTRRAYLDEILPLLWPAPARVTSGGRAKGPARGPSRARGGAHAHVRGVGYVLLPSAQRPTVMVPLRPRRAAAAVLRNYKSSATPAQQVRLLSMSYAARMGVTDLLPGRVWIDSDRCGPSGTLELYLSEVLGREIVVSVYVGPPGRANLKPVLQLLTGRGETFGFAKIGVTPLTVDLVAAEATALDRLGAAGMSRVGVPQMLHHGQWRGLEVLVQEALPRVGRGAVNAAALSAAMVELAEVGGTRTGVARASSYWVELGRRLAGLPQTELSAELVAVWERLGTAGDTSLTYGSWHGDWTPWNMSMSGDRALVWDWERFSADVPVGFDALHFAVQSAIVRGGVGAADAVAGLLAGSAGLLAPFGVTAAQAPLVAALYLVEIGTRYLADGQAAAGAALGDLEQWLLPALRRHVEHVGD